MKINIYEGGQPRVNMIGKLMKEEAVERKVKTPNGEFPKYFEYKYYENGTYSNMGMVVLIT